MSAIPGIDDCDDDQLIASPAIGEKRSLSPDADGDVTRDKRRRCAEELDDEDRDLYGDADTGRTLVAGMTLVTEKLALNESEFLNRLLSVPAHQKLEQERMKKLFSLVEQLRTIDTTNVFQVTFMTCLWLEAEKRMRPIAGDEFKTFYPFLKTKAADMMHLSCFSISSKSEGARLKHGQLASVRVMPIDLSDCAGVDTLAYVVEDGRRLPDDVCRLESDVLNHIQCEREDTIVHEIVLLLPLTDNLFKHSKFIVHVAPVSSISDLLVQVRAVYDIPVNPLFRYLLKKDFSLSPTGSLITSDAAKFSPLQLEAIQRAFDLVMQPVPSQGNPCKAVFVDGQPEAVRQTIIEIIHQLSSYDATKNQQYIVTSSDKMLSRLLQEVRRLHPDIKTAKIFHAGHESVKINNYAMWYIGKDISALEESIAKEVDVNKKTQDMDRKSHYEKCLSFLSQSNSSATDFHPGVQITIDAFKHKALHYSLNSARLIFGTLHEFSQSPDLHHHLRSPKVYPLAEQAQPDAMRKLPLSVCMFADTDSLTDPELMAFASEFSICRFILSSGWFPNQQPGKKTPVSVQQSLSARLRQISATSEPPLVVDVGGSSV